MAPSTTATTSEPIVTASASEQSPHPIAKANGDSTPLAYSTPPPTAPKTTPMAAPTHEQKNFRDILSYEDKWIGWDGPVWCNRYGRFENKEQAAEDDGYKFDNPVVHKDPETHKIHQCQLEGCACRVPFEHRSYVKDIQRRIEPMTASLVALEHQVDKLVHGMITNGEHAVHNALHHEDGIDRFAMHSANGHQADGPMHAELFEKHRETMAETIAKLEAKVHSLTHQLHVLVKQNDHLMRTSQVGPGEHHYWQVPQ